MSDYGNQTLLAIQDGQHWDRLHRAHRAHVVALAQNACLEHEIRVLLARLRLREQARAMGQQPTLPLPGSTTHTLR